MRLFLIGAIMLLLVLCSQLKSLVKPGVEPIVLGFYSQSGPSDQLVLALPCLTKALNKVLNE